MQNSTYLRHYIQNHFVEAPNVINIRAPIFAYKDGFFITTIGGALCCFILVPNSFERQFQQLDNLALHRNEKHGVKNCVRFFNENGLLIFFYQRSFDEIVFSNEDDMKAFIDKTTGAAKRALNHFIKKL